MTIEISNENISKELAVLTITGRMNAATTPEIKERMKALLDSGHKKNRDEFERHHFHR